NFSGYLTELLQNLPAVIQELEAKPELVAALGIQWVSQGFSRFSSGTRHQAAQVPGRAWGGDLIWWRESCSTPTAVTIWGGETDLRTIGVGDSEEQNEIIFQLYDIEGNSLATWAEKARPGVPLTVDSKNHPNIVEEGVLAVHLTASTASAQ